MFWTFVIKKGFYFNLQEQEEIEWNSPKDAKKDDIIFVYTASPYSSIGFILKVISDPFKRPTNESNGEDLRINVKKIIEIPEPISLQDLMSNNILSKWTPVNKKHFQFQGSHFKMSDEEYNELKRLILIKNPELEEVINNNTNLRSIINKVLIGYLDAKNESFNSYNPIYKLIKDEFTDLLNKITNNADIYKFDGSSGQGNWAKIPWVAVLNRNISETVQSGYYPVYLFKEDMSGVYLSLNQGVTKLKNELGINKAIETLNSNSLKFREKINNYVQNSSEYESEIFLNHPLYEAGNIYAKYYTADNLPSEEKLESDYKEILELYNQLSSPDPEIGIRNFIKKVLENYLAAKNNIKLAKELVTFANGGDFHKYLINIANQSGNGNYGVYGDFGASDKLIWLPYVKIHNTYATRFHIRFAFREDMKGVYLSINQAPWTMDAKLKKMGLNVQKFSEEFQNYLKKEVLDARTELKRLKLIPDDFTNKIDLHSENAKSASSIEAGNLYSKYYTLENLHPEEALISDFKELLTIYEKLDVEPNRPKLFNIKESLEIIFNKLPVAKKRNEVVKDHEIGKEFSYISNTILDIANSIHPEKNYHSVGYYQANGSWYKRPYIYIEDLANKDKYGRWDQHFVGFWFPEDLDGVLFSLQNGTNYSENLLKDKLGNKYTDTKLQNYLKQHINQIKKELNDSNIISENLLVESSKLKNKNAIYGKYYDKDHLPSNEEIISDFKELFNLYSQLTPDNQIDANGLKIIEDTDEIEKYQMKLESILRNSADKIVRISPSKEVFYLSKSGIWASSGNNPNFYFNLFGVGHSSSINETIVEINIPHSEINKSVSGAFAKDDSGQIFLVHRGKLGGKFAGKPLLEENYEGKWVEVANGENENKYILIGSLDKPDFLENLKNFVFDVCKIKKGEECVNNQNFFECLIEKGYLFDQKLVENFLLSLKVKPFVILTGNSGTGKTKVAQLFAKYINPKTKTSKEENVKEINKHVDLTSNTRRDKGGWELKANELEVLKDFSENLTLEVHRGRTESPKRGKGYIKDNKLYYIEETPFFDEINTIIGGSRTEIQIIAKKYEEFRHYKKHEIVPVGANWTENRHVIGFYNVITEKYQKTQALNLILKASQEIDDLKDYSSPYFLILDEMNLSNVERYFSDFLSVMESEEPMPLHDNVENEIPQELKLPENIFVIGTVNVDETTYMFSPKVLDRANTIEFLTQPPLNYMRSQLTNEKPSGNINYLQNPLSDLREPNIRNSSIDDLRELMKHITTGKTMSFWDEISLEIDRIYNKLKKAGFDFGFRVINEIMRFMYVAWKYEGSPLNWDNWERYFDAQIKQKMLPKLHGSQRTLQEVIKSLFEICYGKEIETDPRSISDENVSFSKYPTAALKLWEMDKVLYEQRYVAFIN